MTHRFPLLAATLLAAICFARSSDAQFVTYYSPVAPVTYVEPAPTVVYRPAPVVAYSPVAYTVARPVVAATTYAPVATVRTRWRPILGGTVTRVRYRYAPVTVAYPAY